MNKTACGVTIGALSAITLGVFAQAVAKDVGTLNAAGLHVNGASVATARGDILSGQRQTGTLASSEREYQQVSPGATATLINYAGGNPGYIDQIKYAISSTDGASFNNATINIYVDGSSIPSISIPAPAFFEAEYIYGAASGSKFSNLSFSNRFFSANAGPMPTNTSVLLGGFLSMMPIPFGSGVKITISNGSSSATETIFYYVKYQTDVPNTWPYTRHLRMAYTHLSAPSADSHVQLLNVRGRGRYLGIWFMSDDVPNGMRPLMAEMEGDFRLYVDKVSSVWAAATSFSLGNTIVDSNGNLEEVTTAGTSGSSRPTWTQGAGQTTTDGTITWTETPGTPNQIWQVSRPYVPNMMLLDSNGSIERVTTAGTSGNFQPNWSTTVGGTTTDGSITWTNQGSTYLPASWHTDGTESYFVEDFYWLSIPSFWTSNGYIGTTFGNWNGSPTRSNMVNPSTIGAYRFHTVDPIRFNNQITLMWQVGDTSQMAWSSGSPDIWAVVYYYTEF